MGIEEGLSCFDDPLHDRRQRWDESHHVRHKGDDVDVPDQGVSEDVGDADGGSKVDAQVFVLQDDDGVEVIETRRGGMVGVQEEDHRLVSVHL